MAYQADRNQARRGRLQRVWRDEAGFSLLEMILISVIAGGVMAMAIFGLGSSISAARSRGAIAQIKQQLTNAREMSISQQRDIKVEFTEPDRIRLLRIERPSGTETVIASVRLEGGMTFQKYTGLPETPDPWGGTGAIAFGGSAIRFRSGDGALVDGSNNFVNGRVFVGLNTKKFSAGMVSVFGATGRIRSYRATGGTWEY
jgi:type II secretory pathway pseudopilin PulG